MSFDASFAPLDPDNVAGTFALFDMVRVGGIWGVPRSGLVYRRDNDTTLTLIERMPWMPEMEGTITAEQLAEQQQSDHDGMVAHLGAAGVTVNDATSPEREETDSGQG